MVLDLQGFLGEQKLGSLADFVRAEATSPRLSFCWVERMASTVTNSEDSKAT